jgi:hypothetical protein
MYRLKKGELHGRFAWQVWDGSTQIGWVVQEVLLQKSSSRNWAAVPIDHDEYEDLAYWYGTRAFAVESFNKEKQRQERMDRRKVLAAFFECIKAKRPYTLHDCNIT